MSARLEGRTAIVTGAGSGLGRSHALALAAEGARVVVNDVDRRGNGMLTRADLVVNEIRDGGGEALASTHDIGDWKEASCLVGEAISHFGSLDVLVNNAGIVRDRSLANMSEVEWDEVIRVHLKGHAAMTTNAVRYWRSEDKAGRRVAASVINTISVGAFAPAFGQANYTAAKLGILGLSLTVAAEAEKYGVRSNCISPSARTGMTMAVEGASERLKAPDDPGVFDRYAPENVSPLVVWLADANCPANRQIFHIGAGRLVVGAMPSPAHVIDKAERWSLTALDRELPDKLVEHPGEEIWFGSVPSSNEEIVT